MSGARRSQCRASPAWPTAGRGTVAGAAGSIGPVGPARRRAEHESSWWARLLAGAAAAAALGRARLPVKMPLFSGSPATRAQRGCARRHQRREELPERRRQHRAALPRHIKGGDFRSREANVYRLAQLSGRIIDNVWPRGCPLRANTAGNWPIDLRRRAGRAHLLCRGQTGQQLLLGAYHALARGRRGARAASAPGTKCWT